MGLQWSAVTLASHLGLVIAVLFAFANAVRRVWSAADSPAVFRRLEGPVFAIVASLVVERLYYVTARLLVNTDIDLWSAHPAPELLSFMLMASIFSLAVAIRHLGVDPLLAVRRVVWRQGAAIGLVFLTISVGLW